MLKLQNYSDTILHEIDFELKSNQNLIILGENGAGKSTLAKVLCGVIPSDIVLGGKPLAGLSGQERSRWINYIPAKMEIFDAFISVEEYLNLSHIQSLLEPKSLLRLLGIEGLRYKSCHSLSSGEQQLVMLLTSILHNAQITIFDEPTANLDPNKSRDVFSLLKKAFFKSRIVITHDLTLAYRLGYDIIYMQEGKISFRGTSKEFFLDSNLDYYFGSSVKRLGDFIVVNL